MEVNFSRAPRRSALALQQPTDQPPPPSALCPGNKARWSRGNGRPPLHSHSQTDAVHPLTAAIAPGRNSITILCRAGPGAAPQAAAGFWALQRPRSSDHEVTARHRWAALSLIHLFRLARVFSHEIRSQRIFSQPMSSMAGNTAPLARLFRTVVLVRVSQSLRAKRSVKVTG